MLLLLLLLTMNILYTPFYFQRTLEYSVKAVLPAALQFLTLPFPPLPSHPHPGIYPHPRPPPSNSRAIIYKQSLHSQLHLWLDNANLTSTFCWLLGSFCLSAFYLPPPPPHFLHLTRPHPTPSSGYILARRTGLLTKEFDVSHGLVVDLHAVAIVDTDEICDCIYRPVDVFPSLLFSSFLYVCAL